MTRALPRRLSFNPEPTATVFYNSTQQQLRNQLLPLAYAWDPDEPLRADPNLPRFLATPVCYGTRRVKGATATVPKIGSDGNLAIVKTWGRGPLQLSNLRLGDQLLISGRIPATSGGKAAVTSSPIGPFYYELIEGRVGDLGLSTYPQITLQSAFSAKVKFTDSDSFNAMANSQFTPPGTSDIDVRVSFPKGIATKYNGKWVARSVRIRIACRKKGTNGDASANGNITRTFTCTGQKNINPLEVAASFSLGAAKEWEIAMEMDWIASQFDGKAPECNWVRLDGRGSKTPAGLTGFACLALQIPVTAIGGDLYLSQLTAETLPELLDWTGSAWVVRATRSPVAAYRDILQGLGNPNPVADARLDLPALQAWADECTSRGFSFDFPFAEDGATGTIQDALRIVCQAGRAARTMRDGLHSVIVEPNPATAPTAGWFCPANSWGLEWDKAFTRLPHAVRGDFSNAAAAWAPDARAVFAAGYNLDGTAGKIAASIYEAWPLDGVTGQAAVDALLAYHMSVAAARPRVVTFMASWEQIRCTRGDVVRVCNDRLGLEWGTGYGRVVEVLSATQVRIENKVQLTPAAQHLRVRKPDSTDAVLTVSAPATVTYTDLITTTAAHGASVGDLCFLGASGADSKPCVVIQIESLDDLNAKLTVAPLTSSLYNPTAPLAGAGAAPPAQQQAEQSLQLSPGYGQSMNGDSLRLYL